MTSLYNQLLPQFLAIDLKLCIAVTDTLKMCTCYFEEKWGRDRGIGQQGDRQAQHGGRRASSLSYIHNFLVYYSLLAVILIQFNILLKSHL